MYIVTIREKGKDKPLLERECDCVIGADVYKRQVEERCRSTKNGTSLFPFMI